MDVISDFEKTARMLAAYKNRFDDGDHIITVAPDLNRFCYLHVVFVNAKTMEKTSMVDLNIRQRTVELPQPTIPKILDVMFKVGVILSEKSLGICIDKFIFLFDIYIENARCK